MIQSNPVIKKKPNLLFSEDPLLAALLAPPTGGEVLGLSMTTVSLTTGSWTHL